MDARVEEYMQKANRRVTAMPAPSPSHLTSRTAAEAVSGRHRHHSNLHTSPFSDSIPLSTAYTTPKGKQERPQERPPPKYLSSYLKAMEATMNEVWNPLGFSGLSAGDFNLFGQVVQRYYKRVFANPSEVNSADDLGADEDALLTRNGLWVILSNAVFYCLTVLDPRRLRARAADPSEVEVCTGGVEDEYEVVYSSTGSTSEEMGDEKEAWRSGRRPKPAMTYYATPFVPAPLQWGRADMANKVPGKEEERASGSLAHLHACLTELPIADWYLTLRCLAQVGYRRDTFYTQTPSQGSPHELMLALLWLTQKYELVAVVEYIELNTHYGFLLTYHSDAAKQSGGKREEEWMLLNNFGQANPWPPTGFDETGAIAARLSQIDALVGSCPLPSRPADDSVERTQTDPHGGGEKTSVAVRRLMALQRLVTLSLNRLQHALEQRAEQTGALGLHSSLDVQLCARENHAAYTRVIDGLQFVSAMRPRVQGRLQCVGDCGRLVAQALRRTTPLIKPDEVVAGLKEDNNTWLAGGGGDESATGTEEGFQTENLASVLGRFRAARTKQYLLDRWKSIVRQEHTAPGAPSSSFTEDDRWESGSGARQPHLSSAHGNSQQQPFALDGNAQYREECRVQNNVISRYSLSASLAAEVLVMQYQERRRRKHAESAPTSVNTSVVSTTSDAALGVTTVALLPLALKTTACTSRLSDGCQDRVGSKFIQATEVGPPAPGATTSARVETDRLRELQQDLASFGEQKRHERVVRCQQMLKQLYQVYNMRLALGCMPTKLKKNEKHQQQQERPPHRPSSAAKVHALTSSMPSSVQRPLQ